MSLLRLREASPLRDNVRLVHRDIHTGAILAAYSGHNLVPTVGRKANLQALGGLIPPLVVGKIQLGTGGVDGSGNVLAPTYADTGLAAPLAATLKSLGSDAMASDTDLNLQALWTSDEANAMVSEAALWLCDASSGSVYCLFARYTFPATYMLNDRGTSLQAIWDVTQ